MVYAAATSIRARTCSAVLFSHLTNEANTSLPLPSLSDPVETRWTRSYSFARPGSKVGTHDSAGTAVFAHKALERLGQASNTPPLQRAPPHIVRRLPTLWLAKLPFTLRGDEGPLYRAKPGDTRFDRTTGEIRPTRHEPDAGLHFEGTGEFMWGTKFVLVAARKEDPHGRIQER